MQNSRPCNASDTIFNISKHTDLQDVAVQLQFMERKGQVLSWFMLLQFQFYLCTATDIKSELLKICLVDSLPSSAFSPVEVVGKVVSSVSMMAVEELLKVTITEAKVVSECR